MPEHHSPLAVTLAMIGAVVCGGLVAAQSRINGELGRELGDGYLAAVISFGSGFVIMAGIVLVIPAARRGVVRVVERIRSGSTPWWYAAGGAAGGLFVLSQGLTAALLGVALFTVATIAGQTVSGLLVDRRGIGSMRPKAVTASRVVGAVLAVFAVALAVSPQLRGGVEWWVLVMPLVAGLGLAWQQAVNGQVREISRSALTATFFNFLVGAVLLVIVFAVHALLAWHPVTFPANPLLYVGGVNGILFVTGFAIAVRFVGVLLLGLGAIAGQLAVSLLFDLLLPVAEHPVEWTTIVGTAVTFIAIGIASLPRARRGGVPG